MSQNLSAFLLTIRYCEGTAGPNGYRTHFGGSLFDGYADHPRRAITASGYTSTAAGAYQILAGTWDDYCRATGPHGFTPPEQDACAVWLINRRGALADVEAGRIEAAIAKCGKEWASLPGSPYGQPTRTLAYCLDKYQQAGGTLSVQSPPVFMQRERAPNVDKLPANIQEPKTMGGLAALLVQTLVQSFAPLARDKINGALAKHGTQSDVGGQLVDAVLNAVQPGLASAPELEQVAAVAAAQKQPQVLAKAEAAALDLLGTLAPLMDKVDAYERGAWAASEDSMDRAAARGIKAQEAGLWGNPQFIIAAFILAMVAGVVFTVLYRDTFSSDMQSFVIGAIVGSALTAVISFFFGTSRSSAAKDVVIGELAARR